jgi:hypothetical protein
VVYASERGVMPRFEHDGGRIVLSRSQLSSGVISLACVIEELLFERGMGAPHGMIGQDTFRRWL